VLRYFVVEVVVSVLLAVPAGVSTVVFEVDVVEDSVLGLVASTVTLVEDDGGVGAGCTTVVELAGAVGSFTTVVEDVEAGRSHAARPIANTAARGISLFIGCLQ
jgi:hypothetical protein